jgi:N,N'-diacetyllegionaminate synthase
MAGWDHVISANPEQMRTIVREGKNIIAALGSGRRTVSNAEMEKRKKFRRSLVARQALSKGRVLSESDFDAKRPGTGVAPDEIQYVIGRTLASDLAEDQVLRWSHLL